jgi:hypothetical protein
MHKMIARVAVVILALCFSNNLASGLQGFNGPKPAPTGSAKTFLLPDHMGTLQFDGGEPTPICDPRTPPSCLPPTQRPPGA